MNTSVALSRRALLNRGLLLEYITVGWNILEGVIAVAAGVLAGSPALIGFGADSFVESTSGGVLIWRLAGERSGGHRFGGVWKAADSGQVLDALVHGAVDGGPARASSTRTALDHDVPRHFWRVRPSYMFASLII